MQKHLNSRKNN